MADAPGPGTMACYATSMRKASRRLTALYDEVLSPVGLRSTQYAILAELGASGPITIHELAQVLVLDRSGLGHSLRPLQRDGLVSLEPSTADRRSVEVSLTEQGRDRLREASTLWKSAQDRVRTALGPTVADALRRQLADVARSPLLS